MVHEAEIQSKPWWIFFPFKGFFPTNKGHDLVRPIFGDITIVTKKHLHQIVPMLKANQRMAPGHDHEKDIHLLLEHTAKGEVFESYIAVKRTGRHLSNGSRDNELVRAAKNRAFSVAALLTIVFLCTNKRGETCGLVEQLHRKRKFLTMLDLQEGGFVFQGGGGHSRMILDSRFNIKMSRSELKRFLNQKNFAGLTNILLTQGRNISKSLHNTINQAAIRLADAIHSISPSSQLLGSVTAIEILLSELGDPYDVIKKRLSSLIGSDAYALHNGDNIFNARHRYVHRGDEIFEFKMSTEAIVLSILALLNYSNATTKFSSKQDLLNYLDFVISSERISKSWTSKQHNNFGSLLRHSKKEYSFEFLTTQ